MIITLKRKRLSEKQQNYLLSLYAGIQEDVTYNQETKRYKNKSIKLLDHSTKETLWFDIFDYLIQNNIKYTYTQ